MDVLLYTVYIEDTLFDLMTEREVAELCLTYSDVMCDLRKLVVKVF